MSSAVIELDPHCGSVAGFLDLDELALRARTEPAARRQLELLLRVRVVGPGVRRLAHSEVPEHVVDKAVDAAIETALGPVLTAWIPARGPYTAFLRMPVKSRALKVFARTRWELPIECVTSAWPDSGDDNFAAAEAVLADLVSRSSLSSAELDVLFSTFGVGTAKETLEEMSARTERRIEQIAAILSSALSTLRVAAHGQLSLF